MITVNGATLDISTIEKEYSSNSIEMQLLDQMSRSSETYIYDNLNQLKFELSYRKEIVNSSLSLNNSGLNFAGFVDSRCNPKYWDRLPNGGFLKNKNAKSNEAISDIFINGNDYATECATAVMIIYYKGLLNIYGDALFNDLFAEIYLMDWDVKEPLLQEVANPQIQSDILLGDRGYFINPEYDPSTPEWQGENVIVLPDSMYYGHGIGVATADAIIQDLNSRRVEGAIQSAFLINEVGRPDFKNLSNIYYNNRAQASHLVWKPFPKPLF